MFAPNLEERENSDSDLAGKRWSFFVLALLGFHNRAYSRDNPAGEVRLMSESILSELIFGARERRHFSSETVGFALRIDGGPRSISPVATRPAVVSARKLAPARSVLSSLAPSTACFPPAIIGLCQALGQPADRASVDLRGLAASVSGSHRTRDGCYPVCFPGPSRSQLYGDSQASLFSVSRPRLSSPQR